MIPTKEYVYGALVREQVAEIPATYESLLGNERRRIAWISGKMRSAPHMQYVDVVSPLREAAAERADLYPPGPDGHPLAAGYEVIARALSAQVKKYLRPVPSGIVEVEGAPEGEELAYVESENYWYVTNSAALRKRLQAEGKAIRKIPWRDLHMRRLSGYGRVQ